MLWPQCEIPPVDIGSKVLYHFDDSQEIFLGDKLMSLEKSGLALVDNDPLFIILDLRKMASMSTSLAPVASTYGC